MLSKARLRMHIAGTCAVFALVGCAHDNAPAPGGPAPKGPDPRICAAIEKEPGVKGDLVQPATDEERADLEAFLSGEWAARDWGRCGWGRAKIAKDQYCR
jgi:hypothetical protein